MRLRPLWRRLHLWLGLAGGIVFVLLGLSGSALVYREEMLGLLYPGAMHVPATGAMAPPSALLAAAAAQSGRPVAYLRYPGEPDRPVQAVLAGGGGTLLLDPYTARPLGPLPGGFFTILFDLHSQLLLGDPGRSAVGWFGLLLVAAATSGLVLWWPRGRHWRNAFSIQWRAGSWRLHFSLHRSAGALAALPLLLLGLSGSAIVFRSTLVPAMHALGGARPVAPAIPAPASAAGIDAMAAAALEMLPGSRLAFVSPPGQPGGTIRIRLRRAGEIHQNGRSYVLFDAAGRIREWQDAPALPAANILFDQLPYPLHTGFLFGAAGRFAVFLSGLLPALLFGTGLYLWLRRRPPGRAGQPPAWKRMAPRPRHSSSANSPPAADSGSIAQ